MKLWELTNPIYSNMATIKMRVYIYARGSCAAPFVRESKPRTNLENVLHARAYLFVPLEHLYIYYSN